MEVLWDRQEATVRMVVDELQSKHPVAYTTVMTVMNRLVEQGCLTRRAGQRGAFTYQPKQTREAHVAAAAKHSLDQLVHQYGDLALVQFLEQLDKIPESKLEQLRRKLQGRKRV